MIVGTLAAIGVPQLATSQGRLQIAAAQRSLLATYRVARSSAVSRSTHYRVSLATTYINVSRMMENPAGSGVWAVDPSTVQTIALPAPVRIATSSVGSAIEFDSRGFAVGLNAPEQIDAQDSYGQTKSLQVWPSGQIRAL